MRVKGFILGLMALVFFLVCPLLTSADAQNEKRTPVKIEGKKLLPLRVLTRPYSNVYESNDENSNIIAENVPTFTILYVYTRPDTNSTESTGWYEVGKTVRGDIWGWMKAEDVMEWKHSLCMSFTHPRGRSSVLFFDDKKSLLDILEAPKETRDARLAELYEAIDTKNIPEGFPVTTVEPKQKIDTETAFYLMPIVEHEQVQIDNQSAMVLKAATQPKEGRGKTDIISDPIYLDMATDDTEQIDIDEKLEALGVDIVYVMDTTNSMQPFIDETLKTIRDMSKRISAENNLNDKIRFGIWGYRDDAIKIPGLEYTTNNYTPDLLDWKSFVKLLSEIDVAAVGSGGYEEEVFIGVRDTLTETKWSENSLKLVVLVGDAPAHEHDLAESREKGALNVHNLRSLATDGGIYMATVHIKAPNPEVAKFQPITEKQFTTLASNDGLTGAPTYNVVDSQDSYARVAQNLSQVIIENLNAVKSGKPLLAEWQGANQPSAPGTKVTEPPNEDEEIRAKVNDMFRAALVEYIGRANNVQAPRDITAWVSDKDINDPLTYSLECKVLINKAQLGSMHDLLDFIMRAVITGRITGEDFFTRLQAIVSVATNQPNQIENAANMVDTGLVPEFLLDLPYKSLIMRMNNEYWAALSQDQQNEILETIQGCINLYKELHDDPEKWVQINQGDPEDEWVHPIRITDLP